MLISGVLPIMSLYCLPHGQYGYNGHVINLPQDVGSFAYTLPRLPSELDVIVVRKEGATESHHDFRVRRSVVLRALQWLLANNIYYRNVHIDSDALALLPEDGDLTGLCSTTLESSNDDQELSPPQDVDPYDAHLARTFVPSLMCTYTVVTHPCDIPPLAQARPMMLCIYTSNSCKYKCGFHICYFRYTVVHTFMQSISTASHTV